MAVCSPALNEFASLAGLLSFYDWEGGLPLPKYA